MSEAPATGRMRLDKWLWAARFFKTRSLAATQARSGRIRVNGSHVKKASAAVAPGDVLTFPKTDRIFVVRIKDLAERRGPASEARTLYEDLSPPPAQRQGEETGGGVRDRGSGRPTKADRRALDRLRNNE